MAVPVTAETVAVPVTAQVTVAVRVMVVPVIPEETNPAAVAKVRLR